MPRKNKSQSASLGRALIKERFAGNRQTSGNKASSQHFREYSEIEDSAALNLKSVTELNSLDEFLETAELAGTEFTAERLNIKYISPLASGVVSAKENEIIQQAQEKLRDQVRIPRRPEWTEKTSALDLNAAEKEAFLNWRRNLAKIQEYDHITLTPYEKNLDFWRQLWRVIERSDLIVQIVDARDPLLYRCEDLEAYIKDIDPNKQNMILINKADLLSEKQRHSWKEYFDNTGVSVAFWSAVLEAERSVDNGSSAKADEPVAEGCGLSNSKLFNKDELISFFKSKMSCDPTLANKTFTVGMVGYPNVGKSSTINAILQSKKVAVSATPGRTKHFQTFFIEDNLVLCDCPGLVFPSFVTNKAEMVLSGILSIDEIRDHLPPMNLVCQRIPRKVIEATYSINIIKPRDGEDETRSPTPHEVLDAYGSMRGFMTSHGQPDNPRSARILLKDYVKGKLLYCKAPPGCNQKQYSFWNRSIIQSVIQLSNLDGDLNSIKEESEREIEAAHQKVARANKQSEIRAQHEVDATFFRNENIRSFTKGTQLGDNTQTKNPSHTSDSSKPWKKHNNRNKKEKMRRTRIQKLS